MSKICEDLHKVFSKQKIYKHDFDVKEISLNGIYILFEKGEKAHGVNRVVRVGTHRANNALPSRIQEHFCNQKRNKSIFRKNIGRAILNIDRNSFINIWNSRAIIANLNEIQLCLEIENQVTEIIQNKFSFVWFKVNDLENRLKLERKILSTIAQCTSCKPSENWLGLKSPKNKIRVSGLWNIQGLNKNPFTDINYREFKEKYLIKN